MTETEFTNQARAMFDRGEIDTDTFFTMQMQAHLKVAGSDVADGAQIDFVAKFKSLMDFETESGHRSSPLSGYKTYENILSKISTRTDANMIG